MSEQGIEKSILEQFVPTFDEYCSVNEKWGADAGEAEHTEKINEDMFNMLDWDFDKFNKKLKSLTEGNSRGMYHFGVDTRHPRETIFYIEDKSNEPGEAGYVAGPRAYKLFRITNDGQLYSYLKYNEMHEGYDWKLGAIYRRISDWLKQLSFDELHQIMETHRRLSPKNVRD